MFYLDINPDCKHFNLDCHCFDVHEDHEKHSKENWINSSPMKSMFTNEQKREAINEILMPIVERLESR